MLKTIQELKSEISNTNNNIEYLSLVINCLIKQQLLLNEQGVLLTQIKELPKEMISLIEEKGYQIQYLDTLHTFLITWRNCQD